MIGEVIVRKVDELNVFRFKTKVQSSGDVWEVLIPAMSVGDALDVLYDSNWFLNQGEEIVEIKRLEIKSLVAVAEDKSNEMAIDAVE